MVGPGSEVELESPEYDDRDIKAKDNDISHMDMHRNKALQPYV